MEIKIQKCLRGFLVTTPSRIKPEQEWQLADDFYAVPSALAAIHCAATLLGVEPASIYADHHAAIATADGHPATGGGESSQTLLDAFVELAPEAAALIELADEDAPVAGLKAGEAYRDEEE